MADTKAKRGDLVVTRHDRQGYGTGDTADYTVGVVTSVNQAGIAQAYRDASGSVIRRDGRANYFFGSSPMIVGQDEVNVPRAMAAARRHTWPGHPNQVQDYPSLEAVKAALRPYRRSLRGT